MLLSLATNRKQLTIPIVRLLLLWALQIWDVASGQCIQTLRGHNDEILDVSFNSTGNKLVTASADGTSRVYNTMTGELQHPAVKLNW
jgi:hypothetical protein